MMGEFSIWHWLVVGFVFIMLFGAKRFPELMKGVGEGIRNFKGEITKTHDEIRKP